jgi:hypothetical protein
VLVAKESCSKVLFGKRVCCRVSRSQPGQFGGIVVQANSNAIHKRSFCFIKLKVVPLDRAK